MKIYLCPKCDHRWTYDDFDGDIPEEKEVKICPMCKRKGKVKLGVVAIIFVLQLAVAFVWFEVGYKQGKRNATKTIIYEYHYPPEDEWWYRC